MRIEWLTWRGRMLRAWLRRRQAIVERVAIPAARADLAIVSETRSLVPLLVGDGAALHIMACVRATVSLGGAVAEAGVLAGGTARLICAAKGTAPLHLFDTFETLQAGGVTDRGNELRRHFGALHIRQSEAERLLAPHEGVRFHPGIFPDTAAGLEGERFCFVHLDLDLAPSTADALAFFGPRMLPGGILLGDDYEDPAVRRTFEAHFRGSGDLLVAMPWGQAMVVFGGRAAAVSRPQVSGPA